MMELVKTALRLTTDAYDDEINNLIAAALADLGIVGIPAESMQSDALIMRAVVTYCRCNFGSPENYAYLKASYDEQKGQLKTARHYGGGE